MATAPPANVRQNYHPECEAAVNNQMVLELYASSAYKSMASYFDGQAVALEHLARLFVQRPSQEREHKERLMRLQNQRGGHLCLRDLSRPDVNPWENGLQAMECASHLDVSVNQSLLHLHRLASEVKDAHLCTFLSRHCLRGRLGLIKELGDHITTLRKMGAPESGLAEDLSAKLTLGDSDKKN